MLIGLDEYPFHQIAESFAGAATGDPSWNDGHYFGVTDHAGKVSLTARRGRHREGVRPHWAESFARLTGSSGTGAAHDECVVIREAESWSR